MNKRKIRLKNFEKRKSDIYKPFTIAKYRCEYLSIHPFADEEEVLKRLNMKSEECINVDAYFKIKKDIYFLSVAKGQPFIEKTPNCSVFKNNDDAVFMSFYIQHDNPAITRIFFESIIKKILIKGVKRIKNMISHQGFVAI